MLVGRLWGNVERQNKLLLKRKTTSIVHQTAIVHHVLVEITVDFASKGL